MARKNKRQLPKNTKQPPKNAAWFNGWEQFLKQQEKFILAGIFLLAFFVRLIYLWQIKGTPFFDNLIVDCQAYDLWAQRIAHGDILGQGVFFQEPLYPYLLGLVYFIFGHSIFTATLLQLAIGAFNCLLVYFIARTLFDRSTALLAALFCTFYGAFLFFEGMIEKTFLSVFLSDLALLLVLYVQAKRRAVWWLLPGLALGLALLTRGNYFAFIPFLLIYIFIINNNGWKNSLSQALFLVLGLALIISPITLRNYVVGHDFNLITYGLGLNLYTGNNPENQTGLYRPPSFVRPDPEFEAVDFIKEAERQTGRALKPSAASAFWLHKSLEYIKADPGAFMAGLTYKFNYFWNKYEIPDNQDFYFFRQYSSLLSLPLPAFGWIAPLGLLGLVLAWRRWRRVLLLYLFLFSYSASVILTFVFDRYRAPIVTTLIVFAAFSLVWLIGKISNREYQKAGYALLLFIPLFLYVNQDLARDKFTSAKINLASIYQRQGQYEKAIAVYREVIKSEPNDFEAYYGLGLVYRDYGKPREAIGQYQEAIKINSRSKDAHNELGNAYSSLGQNAQAIAEYKTALKLDPSFAGVRNNLGLAYEQLNLMAKAEEQLRLAYESDPGNLIIIRNYGRALFQQGKDNEAVKIFDLGVGLFPNDLEINYLLGVIALKRNETDKAGRYLKSAYALARDPQAKRQIQGWLDRLRRQGK
jgi:Tfp pilus assembly protein PilF